MKVTKIRKMSVKILFILTVIWAFGCDDNTHPNNNCGDGVVDIGEECDGENLNGRSCISEGYYVGELSCNDDCSLNINPCKTEGRCGDGILHQQYGEQCDQSELNNTTCESLDLGSGDLSCLSSCKFDTSGCEFGVQCGNGIVEDGESCDGSNLDNLSCESLNLGSGVLSCNSCELDVSGCEIQPVCGDSIITPPEECDGTQLNGNTCESIGYNGGDISCGDNCKLNLSGCFLFSCGNDNIDNEFEECDGANFNSQSCETLGYYGGTLNCSDNCKLDTSACGTEGQCGDGLIQTAYGETCDGTNMSKTCITLGYSGGTLVCNPDCKGYDESGCNILSTCTGDGVINAGEQCDGTNLDHNTCITQGFMGGELACSNGCNFDTSLCWKFSTITNGMDFTCGLDNFHRVWCWGSNEFGALGVGTNSATSYSYPVEVDLSALSSGEYFEQIDAGTSHICGVTNLNRVWCWGQGAFYQIDGLTVANRFSPELILDSIIDGTIYNFQYVSSGYHYNCAISDIGNIYCWGTSENYLFGYTPQAFTDTIKNPVDFSQFVENNIVSAAVSHSCSTDSSDNLYCWGGNVQGMLGNDATAFNEELPITVNFPNLKQNSITTGDYVTCALDDSNTAWCWGGSDYGMVGDGTTIERHVPTEVVGGHQFVNISAGDRNVCGVDFNGQAWCWGEGSNGFLGDGNYYVDPTFSATPVAVNQNFNVSFLMITVGNNTTHICGLTEDGIPWCWGDNNVGQLGNNNYSDSSGIPVRVRLP